MSSPPPDATRVLNEQGRPTTVQLNLPSRPLQDLYFQLLTSSWLRLSVLAVLGYLMVNTLFAGAYMYFGGIENARPESFHDAFFFSVQTMSTIGYGGMIPRSLAANVLVTLEAFVGLVGFALATGLMFSKFARPTARVMFSKVAVVGPHNGVPCLQFRVANQRRDNQILEAQLRVTVFRNEKTLEGTFIRRMIDIPLTRERMGMFSLGWLAMHPIVTGSPFHGVSQEALTEQAVEVLVSFTGTDEVSSQFVHARQAYQMSDIHWNARLVDILDQLPDGRRAINYARFHEYEAL